jgi:DNA-binding beta-propeller fold protein YncE
MGSNDAPNACILDGVAHRPPLYLLIEGQGDDALAIRLAAAAADAYRRAHGSLTGALLAVVRAVELALRDSKPSGLPQYGLSALLVSGAEAILAQVEPAACWHLQDAELRRLPAQSAWNDPALDGPALRRLGGGLGQDEPELTRIALQPGDRFLLGTTSIARDVGEFLIAEAMAQPNPAAALHDLVPDLSFSALSVQPLVPPLAKRAPVKTSDTGKVDREAPNPVPVPPSPTPSAAGAKTLAASRVRAPQPIARREAFERDGAREARRRKLSLPSISLRPYLEVVILAVLFVLKFFWTLISGFLRLLARALPDRETSPMLRTPQARRQVMESNPLENRVLFTLALAIPVLVLIGVAAVRNQSAAAQTVHVADVMNRANAAYQAAVTMQNSDARKAALNQASQLVDEALSANPRDQVAKDLQTKIVNELDKLNNVTKFFFYPVLFSFDDKDSHPATVIARGSEIYVLDTGLNRLYKFTLNDNKDGLSTTPASAATPAPAPNPVVMRQGDERGSIVIGRLSDIFWASAGGGRSGTGVLTLTASKQVVEYVPARGANVLGLGAANGWKEATLGESFGGNLYILDANANRILKFAPTGEDYRGAPTDYVAAGQKVDFAGAADVAIDGFVWVLLADGTVMKFDTGNLLPFGMKGLEQPLRKPVALALPPNSQSVWVADAGNRRIVQLNKNGDFMRQLKPDDANVMNDLRGLAVDEAGKRFYFVNGNRLYMGTLQN